MDNYCNEIGQKMRSAVKAKLLELGTGGSAGYIDDELPDYVMIMVANKRSKQQMITDLNLFLGTQTELFVTWLHEVLHKLQEVTLPATSVTKKRKTAQHDETNQTSSANKKGKKIPRKEKEKSSSTKAKEPTSVTPERAVSNKSHSSITDVFAEELLEKAKQSLDDQADANLQIKKSKNKASSEEITNSSTVPEQQTTNVTNEFDIPTISEISSTTGVSVTNNTKPSAVSGSREKDLEELAEIQKKIYAAKKQLKQLGEADDDDEDFLKIRDEDSHESFNEAGDLVRKPTPPVAQTGKKRSPIVFENKSNEEQGGDEQKEKDNVDILLPKRRRFTPPPQLPSIASSHQTPSDHSNALKNEKRPVHERLGLKNTSSNRDNQKTSHTTSRERRRVLQDKELYVPAFRRKEVERERERDRDQERSRDRDRVRERGRERERRMDRSRDRDRDNSRMRSRQSRSLEERTKRRSNSEARHIDERNSSQVGKITTTTPSGSKRDCTTSSSSGASASPEATTTPQRKRVGSRVIVAPTKPTEASDEDDLRDKPVNSIIKIKPRPAMSPSKQAPKNLLLKAVAEAQRSTILHKPTTTTIKPTTKPKITMRLGEKVQSERSTKLYTKSYRDRLKNTTVTGGVGALFRRTTQNLIVEVNGGLKTKSKTHIENDEDEEYVPELVSDRGESDLDFVYVPQHIARAEHAVMDTAYERSEYDEHAADAEDQSSIEKTQFVVTLNEEKALPKLKRHVNARFSRSLSPPPQVTSSSSRDREPTSTSNSGNSRKINVRERLSLKATSSSSTERKIVSRREACTTPPLRRTEIAEIYRKHKEIKKIIINNDSEDDDMMSPIKKASPEKEKKLKRKYNEGVDKKRKSHSVELEEKQLEVECNDLERSTTPPLKDNHQQQLLPRECTPVSSSSTTNVAAKKRKHTPIKYDLSLDNKERRVSRSPVEAKRRRSVSVERDKSGERRERTPCRGRDDRDSSHERKEDKRKISIRNAEPKKYDNLPSSLNAVPVDSVNYRILKPKERCKYHPNCTKTFCEFYHPSAPCKSFPNCKYGDKCMYSHPRCKYDLACVNLDCHFSHSGPRSTSLLESAAPPLSSSVVPSQNYKSITANTVIGSVSSTTCKYFPNCTKTSCPFYHPKPCRWGKNCISKLECMFYHQELPSSSKFKWVASIN